MKRRGQFLTVACTVTMVLSTTRAYADPEITGIPRRSEDKVNTEQARLSTQLRGSRWMLSDDREHTPASFLRVPVKPNIQRPLGTQLRETDCSIGYISKPNEASMCIGLPTVDGLSLKFNRSIIKASDSLPKTGYTHEATKPNLGGWSN